MKWLNDIWTAERLHAFTPLLTNPTDRQSLADKWKMIPEDDRDWLCRSIEAARIPTICAPAFVLPVLSSQACQELIQRSHAYDWTENEDEAEAYRMPEVVLQHVDPACDGEVKRAMFAGLAPWLIGIWGRLPDTYASVQLARYSPDERQQGNYHIDDDADYTAVIALNNDFQGGGTAIVDGMVGEWTIPPVPPGFALVFDGKRTLHKGLPVTQGTRYLLTVWAENDPQSL